MTKQHYFVISGNANRTDHPTIPAAAGHVTAILRGKQPLVANETGGYTKNQPQRLYIVKLVRVVEIAAPPVEVRKPGDVL